MHPRAAGGQFRIHGHRLACAETVDHAKPTWSPGLVDMRSETRLMENPKSTRSARACAYVRAAAHVQSAWVARVLVHARPLWLYWLMALADTVLAGVAAGWQLPADWDHSRSKAYGWLLGGCGRGGGWCVPRLSPDPPDTSCRTLMYTHSLTDALVQEATAGSWPLATGSAGRWIRKSVPVHTASMSSLSRSSAMRSEFHAYVLVSCREAPPRGSRQPLVRFAQRQAPKAGSKP